MASREVVKQLRKLSKREREILKLRCDALEIAECCRQLNLSGSAVKTYIGRIYLNLILTSFRNYRDGKPYSKFTAQCLIGKQGLIDLIGQLQSSVQPPKRLNWLIVGILLGMLLTTAGIFFISRLTSVAPPIIIWTATPSSSLLTTTPFSQIGSATQQSQLNQTAQIVAVAPPTYTPYPTNTPYPTYTPYPELTLAPTSTPIVIVATPTLPPPTPTPEPNILFQDNFDNGLSNSWKVESGNPIIVNGMLTTDQDTWLTIGDASWKNYAVEFDVVSPGTGSCSFDDGWNAIGVRVTDLGNMIAYQWTGCNTLLQVVEKGKWNPVPNIVYRVEIVKTKVKITVQNGNLLVFVAGQQQASYVNNKFSQGKIALKLKNTALIDNFIVTQLP